MMWEFLSDRGVISSTVLPAPSVIGATFLDLLLSGEIFIHVGISFWRIIQGFAIGSFLGVAFGILIGLNKGVEQATSLITGILRPIPIMAWVPVLILWMGIDESSKITVIAIGSFWPVLINVIDGIKNTDKKYLEVAKILEKNKRTFLLRVILPSALPSIFTGLRVGMDLAWRSVVGAELIAASAGIGYMMSYARELSQTDVMLAGVLCIGLVGLLLDIVLKKIQAHFIKWNVNYFK
ncbi:ABC transporter permease [Niallia sp. NCCP-28]|uniref:ABC transporter permease n=1 Tax=Niallia sp. NCCP-28 TaxID=2934712 RepID=UPI0020846396|nr:ABC transporter permease [Niallia sp. NCCP-28]GKU84720.1 ABC transporter permease [Niallia sp. NCCP-28]